MYSIFEFLIHAFKILEEKIMFHHQRNNLWWNRINQTKAHIHIEFTFINGIISLKKKPNWLHFYVELLLLEIEPAIFGVRFVSFYVSVRAVSYTK